MLMELEGAAVTLAELSTLALHNYGHFTTMKVQQLRVRGLSLHLDRLVRDCRQVFGADLDRERVRTLVRRGAQAGPSEVLVRVTVFDPRLGLGHPAGTARPAILVTTRPVSTEVTPVRLRSVRYLRDLPAVKHTGLFGALHHRRRAQLDGFDDALFIGSDHRVSEGPTWNVGLIIDGCLTWPAAESLPGVTMRLVSQASDRLGIAQRIAPVALTEISERTAAFITNAAIGVRPVSVIDDIELADEGALVERLRDEYEAIEGEPL